MSRKKLSAPLRRFVLRAAAALGAVCLAGVLPQALPAQETTAKVVGIVTDPSGAAVPATEVTIRNVDTGVDRSTKSNEAGNYEFSFLPVGRYAIAATAHGFQKTSVREFVLTVGQVARVNVGLQVGEVTQSVEVQANVIALQTEDATVGTIIDSRQVEELPLNGRSFVQLATLTPGVQPGTPGSITSRRNRGSLGQDVAMSASGARDTQNRFYFDGIEAMDLDSYNFSFSPSIDAIQEFKVHTSTFSSETGGAPGGQVNLTTKSGTNSLHGTAWWFNRNDALAALAPFQPYNPSAHPPKLNRNQFGSNIGGPVVKNRTFFFFNWESGRLVSGTYGGRALVPPTAYRTGDFSAGATIYDPATGRPFPGNRIPSGRIQSYASTFLSKFVPQPNADEPSINYRGPTASAPINQDQYIARVDHRLSDRQSLYGSYMFNTQKDNSVPTFGFDSRGNRARAQLASLRDTFVISPSMVNELELGWHRFYETEFFGTTGNPQYDIANIIGIGGAAKDPRNYGAPYFAQGYTLPGTQNEGPRNRLNQNWEVNDKISLALGKHSFKAGLAITRRNWTYDESLDPRGSFTFDGAITSGPRSPVEEHSFAAFLLGTADSAHLSVAPYAARQNQWWQSYYFQDDWKLRPNLTLNLGMRYEYFSSPNQRGPSSNFDLNGAVPGFTVSRQTYLGFTGIADSTGVPANLVTADKNNFGPRVGFAYSPKLISDFVIRGGYGIYFFPEITNTYLNLTLNPPIVVSHQYTGSVGDTVNPATVFLSGIAEESKDGLDGAYAIDPNLASGYGQSWNLTVQKRLPGRFYAEAAYVGSAGKNLSLQYDGNRPITPVVTGPGVPSLSARRPLKGYDAITTVKSTGQATYHSLQMKVERRVASGLTVLGAYTWAHAIDNADISTVGGGSYTGKMQDIFNLGSEKGNSVFDIRHRFSMSLMYDIPFPKTSSAAVQSLFGGWRIGTITTLQTGFAATVVGGGSTTGTGATSRPNIATGQTAQLSRDERSRDRWFNTTAFSRPQQGFFGNATRGNIHLPGVEQVDFMTSKNFRLAERANLEFRTEFFNFFNHVNLGAPGLNIQSTRALGRITSANQGAGATNPGRTVQFGLKLRF
ncbi:MAG: TonB-dependent receptor [Candidatus Solibacter usitatus]|nr:TonB-dependent receptor [Candidatus Solibacter usitatus]